MVSEKSEERVVSFLSSGAIEPKNGTFLRRGARGRYDHFLMILVKLGSQASLRLARPYFLKLNKLIF